MTIFTRRQSSVSDTTAPDQDIAQAHLRIQAEALRRNEIPFTNITEQERRYLEEDRRIRHMHEVQELYRRQIIPNIRAYPGDDVVDVGTYVHNFMGDRVSPRAQRNIIRLEGKIIENEPTYFILKHEVDLNEYITVKCFKVELTRNLEPYIEVGNRVFVEGKIRVVDDEFIIMAKLVNIR